MSKGSRASLQHLASRDKLKRVLPDDFYYEADSLIENQREAREIERNKIKLHHSFGFDSLKRSNIFYLDDLNVVTAVGNILVFINLTTLEQKFFPALRGGGIGAIAVHPSRKYIAVAEISYNSPLIYILEYPSLKIYRVCREGTERAYSNICFNAAGDKLASVGSNPDYMLTIWKWKEEQIVLRSKAFSQDVYRVQFAPDNDGILTTSGMGHIKFWKMSATFTGLKLQGYLGKFGATELSDISAFIQLPDGKVLSSTETGNLLLWDGGMIKCEISGKGRKPCHQGRVEVVTLVEGEVFTAGEDGYVRIWDLETIDNADVVTAYPGGAAGDAPAPADRLASRVYELEPLDEILIGKDVKIVSMTRSPEGGSEFLIQDALGKLFKLDIRTRDVEKLASFHSGPIAGADVSPLHHSLLTLGSDGILKLYNYVDRTLTTEFHYSSAGTFLSYVPIFLDGDGCTAVAGFADGVLRVITHDRLVPSSFVKNNDGVPEFPSPVLQYVFKPHTAPITNIKFSSDCGYMATTSSDNSIFFFKVYHSFDTKSRTDSGETPPPPPFSREKVTFVPLGYIQLDAPATSLTFSPDNHTSLGIEDRESDSEEDTLQQEAIEGVRFMLTTDNNDITTGILPPAHAIDNTITFELSKELLQLSTWKFSIPKPKLTVKKQEKTKSSQQNLSESQKNDAQEKTENKETEQQPIIEDILLMTPESKVHCVLYLDGGYFFASLTNQKGECEVRICKFDSPEKSKQVVYQLLFVHKAPIREIKLSSAGRYLLLGSTDGLIALRKYVQKDLSLKQRTDHQTFENMMKEYIQEERAKADRFEALKQAAIEEGLDLSSITTGENDQGIQWLGYGHDSDRGKISSVATTFDDAFIVSVGHEGGIVVWRNTMETIDNDDKDDGMIEQVDEEDQDVSLKKPKKVLPESADDIIDPHTYSIQEAKVKAEKDREMDEAEVKKQKTRNQIAELRTQFLALLDENEATNPAWKIPRQSILVDPGLTAEIEKETGNKIENVRKELEWESQKETIGLNKLKKKFLDDLITEHIEIKAFKTENKVATFRTVKSALAQDSILQALYNGGKNEDASAEDKTKTTESRLTTAQDANGQKAHDPLVTMAAAAKHDNRSKLEARKQLRQQRAALWKELMDAKPDENYEDPRDVAAIRYAEQNMGDYKLKTGEKYIVPEDERVDADKKKRQLALLKESIFGLKENFNKKVLNLRDRKKYLTEKFFKYMNKVDEINNQLIEMGETVKTHSWTPDQDPHAYPENRYIVTPEDITQLQKELQEKANAVTRGGGDDILGGFNNTAAAAPTATAPAATATNPASTLAVPQDPKMATKSSPNVIKAANVKQKTKAAKSPLEMLEYENNRVLLKYKKEKYIQTIQQSIQDFDQSVDFLMKERVLLEGDIISADIKLLLLYREWALLKEFEKYDNTLAEKLVLKRQEQNDIDFKIKECQEKLNTKKSDIEVIIKKDKEVQEEFQKVLGDGNKYEELLTKILKRKIKRSKKKVKDVQKADGSAEGENEEEEEEESEEESDFDSDFDSDSLMSEGEMDAGNEVCPSDCDPDIFKKVLDLRERKLDNEDALQEIQKAIEALKKENEALLKKERIINQALKQAESEIQDFQTQKQQKLNELDVVIPLRLHQIQYLEKNALPQDLSPVLVFIENGLQKLKRRIKELQQEKVDIKKNHKDLRKNHVSLINSRKEKQAKFQELQVRSHDVQMLKFGKIIDLEKLERMGVNKNADELRDKIQKQEQKQGRQVEKAEKIIAQEKERLTEVVKENTAKLQRLVNLSESKQSLEQSLDHSQTSVTTEYSGPQKKDILEREKLINLVQHQNVEIEQLKNEIEVLIRKPLRDIPAILRRKERDHADAPPAV